MKFGKFIKTNIFEYLNEQETLKENNSLMIDISKLLNKFIYDPLEFMRIFSVDTDELLSSEIRIKLSLLATKFKKDLFDNWAKIHNNLTANIDDMDVSTHLKELIYPSDVPKLINDTDNFLKLLEKRVKQRKNKALKQVDFSNPYGRFAVQKITPLDIVTDFIKNPNTKFNYTQYEYAQADLDLQLIKLIKSGDLELKTSDIISNDTFKNEMLTILKNGLKGEELINLINISDLKKFVAKFWKKNKKAIENKYIELKNKDLNNILVQTIQDLKK